MSEENFCRYCFEDDAEAKLISPCDCRGSAAFIHKRCAQKWMLVSETKVCELCNAEFRCKPSQWASFKKSLRGSKHEALCYAIVFAVFMAPVILFKSIADALRYSSVLTYEQADRLLTGGLFGTYLLLIVASVLLVAVWVHKCHDDPAADAVVAPFPPFDQSAVEAGSSESDASAAGPSVPTSPTAVSGGIVVVLGDPRSPGQTRRAAAATAAAASATQSEGLTSSSDAATTATNPLTTTTISRPNSPSFFPGSPTRPNSPALTFGASPSVALTAMVFHQRRERTRESDATAATATAAAAAAAASTGEIRLNQPSSETAVVYIPESIEDNSPTTALNETSLHCPSVSVAIPPSRSSPSALTPSRNTPSRASRSAISSCFSIDDDDYENVDLRAHEMAVIGMF